MTLSLVGTVARSILKRQLNSDIRFCTPLTAGYSIGRTTRRSLTVVGVLSGRGMNP